MKGIFNFSIIAFTPSGTLAASPPLPEVNLSLHPEMGDKLGFKIYPGTESGPTRFCLGTEIETTGPVTGNLDIFPKYLQVPLTPERRLIEILELD